MSYNRLIVSIVIFTVASLIKSCLTCDPSSDMVNCYYAFDERNFQTIKAFIDEPRLKYDVTMTAEVCRYENQSPFTDNNLTNEILSLFTVDLMNLSIVTLHFYQSVSLILIIKH